MAQVVDDVDLWAAVLSYLQLPHALNAAQTCRAHLFTALHRARMPCGRLALRCAMHGSTITEWIGNGRECTSRLDRILAMKRPDGQLAILPMLTVLAPRLERLSVMIDPHTAPVYGGMTAESTRDWINRLAPAEAYCPPVNDGARAQLPGCEPWTVLPGCGALASFDLSVVGAVPHDRLHERAELAALALSALVPASRTLVVLDARGVVAPRVILTALSVDLPALRVLRCGDTAARAAERRLADQPFAPWPDALLARLGAALPALDAVDVAYARTPRGVSYADVGALLERAGGRLRHLDLSQVMTYVDFGPALRALGAHAPELRSLAVHGLTLPDAELDAFANGCARLRRVHFVRCDVSARGLGLLLRAARSLLHADLSGADLDSEPRIPEVLLEWIQARRREGLPPARSLVLRQFDDDGWLVGKVDELRPTWGADRDLPTIDVAHPAALRRLGDLELADFSWPLLGRTSLFDSVTCLTTHC